MIERKITTDIVTSEDGTHCSIKCKGFSNVCGEGMICDILKRYLEKDYLNNDCFTLRHEFCIKNEVKG